MSTGPNSELGIPHLDNPSVVHVADGPDMSLDRVAKLAEDRGLPIRMRLAIQLWDWEQYVAWKGQVWKIEIKDKPEAEQLKEALEIFFDLIAVKGCQETQTLLRANINAALGIPIPGEGQETPDAPVSK